MSPYTGYKNNITVLTTQRKSNYEGNFGSRINFDLLNTTLGECAHHSIDYIEVTYHREMYIYLIAANNNYSIDYVASNCFASRHATIGYSSSLNPFTAFLILLAALISFKSKRKIIVVLYVLLSIA